MGRNGKKDKLIFRHFVSRPHGWLDEWMDGWIDGKHSTHICENPPNPNPKSIFSSVVLYFLRFSVRYFVYVCYTCNSNFWYIRIRSRSRRRWRGRRKKEEMKVYNIFSYFFLASTSSYSFLSARSNPMAIYLLYIYLPERSAMSANQTVAQWLKLSGDGQANAIELTAMPSSSHFFWQNRMYPPSWPPGSPAAHLEQSNSEWR